MKAVQIVTGILAAGLAAAFLSGANWAHNADIDSARYIVSGDAIIIAGAVAGALFVVLAARLIYLGVRPTRHQGSGSEQSPARSGPAVPAA